MLEMTACFVAFATVHALASADSVANECVAAPGSQCLTSGASVLQRESKSASIVVDENSPFTKDKHAGCNKMVTACATQTSHSALWLKANWTAWKMGFGLCCNSKYNPDLCGELDDTLFNFSDRNLGGGMLVKDTPDPQLADFCMEADGLLTAHFSHEDLEKDEATAPSAMLLQAITSKAASGRVVQSVSKVARTIGWRKLFAKQSLHSRAQLTQDRISQCRAATDCWEEVAVIRPWLLQMEERAKNVLSEEGTPYCHHVGTVRALCKSKDSQGVCENSCKEHEGKTYCCRWDKTIAANNCYFACKSKRNGQADDGRRKRGMCFPAGARVALSTGDLPVEQLHRGAQLQSPKLEDAATTTAEFLIDNHGFDGDHKTAILEFVEISHEFMKPGRPLIMTADHLLFVQRHSGSQKPSWQLERADAVHEGDAVLFLDATSNDTYPSAVTGVGWIKARGAYAPLTTSGRLFVEGVAVSSLALSEHSWQEAWDLMTPERRTFWAERLLLISILPSQILNYFGMDFDWLHTPSTHNIGKRATKTLLRTFFL